MSGERYRQSSDVPPTRAQLEPAVEFFLREAAAGETYLNIAAASRDAVLAVVTSRVPYGCFRPSTSTWPKRLYKRPVRIDFSERAIACMADLTRQSE